MYVVGFDVAKNSMVSALLSTNHDVIEQKLITNEYDTIKAYIAAVAAKQAPITVACESTSFYHFQLVRACDDLSVECRVLNPILTRQAIKATVRGKKTDVSDAVIIAQLGLRGEGTPTTAAMVNTHSKYWLRVAQKLEESRHAISLSQRSLIERGSQPPLLLCQSVTATISALEQARDLYRQSAQAAVPADQLALLTSIVGIGVYTASIISAEIGDITRFHSVAQLVAFTGFDPRVKQSGTSLNRNTRLTKRGSPHLRRAIFIGGNVARQHDPELKAYYQAKRTAGTSHTAAMMPVCRKLIARIYSVCRRQTPYIRRA